jgi:hypothetical protein
LKKAVAKGVLKLTRCHCRCMGFVKILCSVGSSCLGDRPTLGKGWAGKTASYNIFYDILLYRYVGSGGCGHGLNNVKTVMYKECRLVTVHSAMQRE